MRRILPVLLLALTIFFSGCAAPAPQLVRPDIEIPPRPAMLPVRWTHNGTAHCLNDEDARALLINVGRKDAHIEILEGCLRAVKGQGGKP